jgi:hypothetical protein
MNWSDIGKAVGSVAPVVGGLLGGPAGAAVGSLVAGVLGTDKTPDAVNAALAADPQALAKVQELQINAKVQLQQLAVTAMNNKMAADTAQFQAEAADRADARKLAAQQPKDWVRPTITVLMLFGAFGIVYSVFSGIADALLRDATASLTIGTVIGYWFAELKNIMGFWFGTTHEAQHTNDQVRAFATAPGTVTLTDSIATGSEPK